MQELKSNYLQVTQQEPGAAKEAFACYVALPCVYVILHTHDISNTLLSLILGLVLHLVNILWVLTLGRSSEKRSNSAADSRQANWTLQARRRGVVSSHSTGRTLLCLKGLAPELFWFLAYLHRHNEIS